MSIKILLLSILLAIATIAVLMVGMYVVLAYPMIIIAVGSIGFLSYVFYKVIKEHY